MGYAVDSMFTQPLEALTRKLSISLHTVKRRPHLIWKNVKFLLNKLELTLGYLKALMSSVLFGSSQCVSCKNLLRPEAIC